MKCIRVRAYPVIALSLLVGLSVAVLSRMLAHPPVAKAATTITVTSGADAGGTCPGATCTLRQAIATAAFGDTINFAAGLTTITLTSGELLINKRLFINGPGANLLTVRRSAAPGTPEFRIFDIDSNGNSISDVSITNGSTGGNGAGIFINPGASLEIDRCSVLGNSVNAGGDGAGVFVSTNGGLTVFFSTISGNTASSPDGSSGGGIFSNGMLNISNSTISGNNTSDAGGGIFANSGSVGLSSSTVAGNNASDSGGGIFSNGISVALFNTIVARNTAVSRPDFNGEVNSVGYNLIGNTSGTTITGTTTANQLNVDPLLGPLQNNGGATLTRALLSGSPAIDKGQANSGVEQRLYPRVVDFPDIPNAAGGDGTDIGAFEVQAPGSVTYGTTASWNGGPGGRNTGISFQSSSGTLSIDYIGLQNNTTVVANGTTFVGLGEFIVRTTGTGATVVPGTTFALTIIQDSPTRGSGTLSSTLAGVMQQDASTGLISFSSTSTIIGGVTYTLLRSPIPLVPPVTNGGVTTIQAQISVGSPSRPDESINTESRPTASALVRNEVVAANQPTATPVTFGTNGRWNNGPGVQNTAITFGSNGNTVTITFNGIPQGTTTVNPNPNTYTSLGQFVVSTTGTGATIAPGTTFALAIAESSPAGGLDTIGSTVAGVVSQNSSTGLISFGATSISSFAPVTYTLLQSPIPLVAPSTNGGVTTIQGQIAVAPPMTIQFSAANYPVGEGDQHVDLNVTRLGDTSGAASVSFTTSNLAGAQNCNVVNGAASSRCDFETNIRTVQFAAGETSKTVSVFIIDDSYLEGTETFNVSLTNASGASLGAQSNASVTIADNEIANGANPIDTAGFFVRLHYLDFLNREPDSSGFAFWTNEMSSCGADQQCIQLKRVNVSAAFYLSIEFQQTGYLIHRIYKTAYGDAVGVSTLGGSHQMAVPIVRLNEFLPDTQKTGQGVIVGQAGWEQVLESNKQAFCAEFVQRSRFASAFPATMTPAQFVDALFANATVTPAASERQAAIDEFGGAGTSANLPARGRAVRRVAENPTLSQLETNRAFVMMQFFGYLRRNPNDPQDSDYTGYDFWLTKLNQFNGNFVNAEMVKAFITSGEYRQRFGP